MDENTGIIWIGKVGKIVHVIIERLIIKSAIQLKLIIGRD